ncbi:PREDICTED: small VCP/p97-interacting protein, partial [Cariama cristata]|uniref:small VCP/p97-interacting protein n=1 Tax=Cariama cristata TaxID=54380 RepID=UPI0005207158
KRRQLAEAAEKRQMEASSRGIKNAYSVEQKKKKQEEIEKRIAASGSGGEGGLRTDCARERAFGAELAEVWEDTEAASPQGWAAVLRALRKTDDFSTWVWHSDRLNPWNTARQAQAVPAVGLGWKNLSSLINVRVIPRVCFTLL